MMKTRLAMTVLMSLSMGVGSLAMAQDRDRHDGPPDRHEAPRDARGGHDDHDRGAGPDHSFRRGGRLPDEYRNRQYVVDDWRGHHLNAPPRGYQWVQTGPDYVLAAIATGVIAQVLLNN